MSAGKRMVGWFVPEPSNPSGVERQNTGVLALAPRVFWKGYLKLSLVTCRVTLTPAITEGAKVRFHNINRETHNRVMSQYVDSQTGAPVEDDDQVKGYPKSEDEYVLFEDEEIEDVGLQSTRTIDIETFVPEGSIGWIWYDRPHYLAPDDEVSDRNRRHCAAGNVSPRAGGVSAAEGQGHRALDAALRRRGSRRR
jgi:DNA end-binding protein Ku